MTKKRTETKQRKIKTKPTRRIIIRGKLKLGAGAAFVLAARVG